MPVLKPIRIDPEKLRPEPKYSDDFLYKLISQIVDDAIDKKLKNDTNDKKIKNTIKVYKARDDDN